MSAEIRWAVIETLRRGRQEGLRERECVILSALGLRAPDEEVPVKMLAAATGYTEREVRASITLLRAKGYTWTAQKGGPGAGYELTDLGERVAAAMAGDFSEEG